MEAPVSLQPIYDAREQRTIDLVTQSVDALIATNQPVSKSTVAAKSKELDPEGRGVSESAIRRNEKAYAYYMQHRSYTQPSRKRSKAPEALPTIETFRVKLERDTKRARQRYLAFTKDELVDRLIAIEDLLAQQQEYRHQDNDKLLNRLLKAEAGEEPENFQIEEPDEKTQALLIRLERLKAEKRELKARLMGAESLKAENEELRRQNIHLLNRLKIETADDRKRDAVRFAETLRHSEQANLPEIPEIEF
jgi:hypothetical protein